MRVFTTTLAAMALLTGGAHAQLSVTTIGATDASQCYQNALSDLSTDASACNAALRSDATTRRDRIKTLVNRGIIYNRKGELEAAVKDFDAALALNDQTAEAYLNRGNSRFLEKQFDSALADYQQALALEVHKPWVAWYNIGLAYDAQNMKDKARDAYIQALALNPDFSLAQKKLNQ